MSVTVRQCPPCVLIVDDEAQVRSFLRAALAQSARVVEAETGEQALGILESPRWTVDLVLLDYVLPKQSGLEILRVTKRRWPWIRVAILTGFGSEDLAVQALRAGANDYLKKPIQLDSLLESVRTLTAKGWGVVTSVTSVEPDDDARRADPRIRLALAFLRAHFAEEITLDDVAREAALSRSHFCRLFRHETGALFHEYLLQLRVSRAKALLPDRHLTVGEVAYSVGFNDLSHFDRTFRRIVGRTPTEYRTSLKCAVDVVRCTVLFHGAVLLSSAVI
jgi:YesN/AraC family two-component response regulator